jgi:outer membrane protein, heavy metal efflux system
MTSLGNSMRNRFSVLAWCAAGASFAAGLAGCVRYQPAPVAPAESAAALESRSLADAGLRIFIETNSSPLSEWPLKTWDFQKLALAGFYFHPSLDVARAQWGTAQAGVKTAGGRPNPVLTATPGYSINPASGVSPWFPSVSIDVPIETAGKRGHRVAYAQQLSEAARWSITSTAWQVRSGVRTSLLDYTAARQRAALLQKQLAAQQQSAVLIEQRLQAGAATRSELTVLRLAQARTGLDQAEAARQAAEARARIAEAIGLPARALEGVEFSFDLTTAGDAGKDLTSAEARQKALLGRSDVLAALAEYAASESALQLEIAKQYPDLHLNPGYQFDQGEHKWSLGLSVELPLLNQNQGPIAEAMARREETAARFLALQARVIGGIDRALAVRAATLDQVDRQRQFTRLAQDQAASVEALFKAGAADRLELSNAQIEASASDLAFLEAQIKAQQAIAQLEDAIQHPLGAEIALARGRTSQTHSKP